MTYYANSKTKKKWRQSLWLTQQAQCAYCNVILLPKTATLDHVLPISKGGSNELYNLVLVCNDCNQKKGNTIQEFELDNLVNINPSIDF